MMLVPEPNVDLGEARPASGRPRARRRNAAFSLSPPVIVGAVLAPVAGVVTYLVAGDRSLAFVAVNAALLVSPWIARVSNRQRADPFEPMLMFTVLYCFSFVFVPLNLIAYGKDAFLDFWEPESETRIEALGTMVALSTAGLVAFFVGYYAGLGRRVGRWIPSLPVRWSRGRLRLVVTIYFLVGAGMFAVLVWRVGGLATLIGGLNNRVVTFAGLNYLGVGTSIMGASTLLWWSAAFTRRAVGPGLLLYTTGTVLLVMLQGSKTNLLAFFLTWAILYHYLFRRISMGLVVAIVLALIVVGTAYDLMFREYYVQGYLTSLGGEPLFSAGAAKELWSRFMNNTFIQAQTLMIIVDATPRLIPYQNGATYLALLLAWIPRSMFPGKPLSPAGVLTQGIGDGRFEEGYTFPPSLMGELYLNFSSAGVIVGMLLFGFFWRVLYEYRRAHPDNRTSVLVFALTASMMLSWFRGESLGPTVFWLSLMVPLVAGAAVIATRRKKALA